MTVTRHSDFTQAVSDVMEDEGIQKRFPDGMSAVDVIKEIHAKDSGAFPLCSAIDAADELQFLYGSD